MTEMVLAMKDDQFAMEFSLDWSQMVGSLADGTDKYGQGRVQAALMQTAMGNKTRMVFLPGKVYWVFPERKSYMDFGEIMSEAAADMNSFSSIFDNLPSNVDNVKASKVTLDKTEYLCAQVTSDGTSTKYYFDKKGDLKRIEMIADGQEPDENAVIDITELKSPADKSYFSVKGYVKTPIAELQKLFSTLGG
jgi:hypothetical protein